MDNAYRDLCVQDTGPEGSVLITSQRDFNKLGKRHLLTQELPNICRLVLYPVSSRQRNFNPVIQCDRGTEATYARRRPTQSVILIPMRSLLPYHTADGAGNRCGLRCESESNSVTGSQFYGHAKGAHCQKILKTKRSQKTSGLCFITVTVPIIKKWS